MESWTFAILWNLDTGLPELSVEKKSLMKLMRILFLPLKFSHWLVWRLFLAVSCNGMTNLTADKGAAYFLNQIEFYITSRTAGKYLYLYAAKKLIEFIARAATFFLQTSE